jgi:hypothetical protein
MKNYLFAFTIFIYHLPLHAEVITDGTLGIATSLPGPNYLIDDSLGQQFGSNLFHIAQLKLLKNYSRWQHPHYWSPFLLIGNWL